MRFWPFSRKRNAADPAGTGIVLFPFAGNRSAGDPLSGFAPSTGARNDQAAGSLAGSDPSTMARELDDYYSGVFQDAALRWERMERVHHACMVGRGKRLSKVLTEVERWEVEPTDDSPEAERQAEFLREFYRDLRAEKSIDAADCGGLSKAAEMALDATGKGYSFLAKGWYRGPGGVRLRLRHHPLWFFRRWDGAYQYALNISNQPSIPVRLDEWAVFCRGRGTMEAAGAAVIYQRLPFRQLAELLEKWGIPSVYGRDPNSQPGSPGFNSLMEALAGVTSGWTGVITGQAEIKELTGGGLKGTDSLHLAFSDYCDDWIVSVWMGGSLSTRAKSGSGTLAGGAQADDTLSLVDGDLVWLQDNFNNQVSTPAVFLQFGETELKARLKLERFDESRRKSRRDDAKAGAELGLRIPASWLHKELDLPQAEDKDTYILTAPTAPGREAGAQQPPF